MFCWHCGKEIESSARFCNYCGAKQHDNAPPSGGGGPSGSGNANDFGGGPNSNWNANGFGGGPSGSGNANDFGGGPNSNGNANGFGGAPNSSGNANGFGGGPNNGGNFHPPAGPGSGLEIGLKIFAVICAVLYLINAGTRIFAAIRTFFYTIESVFYYIDFYSVYNIWSCILGVLTFIAYLWMCLVLVLIAFKRTKENSDALLLGVAVGGALAALLSVIQFLMVALFHQITVVSILIPVAGAAVCVGVLYALLYVMGEAPFATVDFHNLSAAFREMTAAVAEACRNLSVKSNKAPGGAPNYHNPNPNGVPNNGGQPYYGPRRLDTNRSLLLYILLSLVTCGIYAYYFIYCMARDVNTACDGDGQKTEGLLGFILLSLVTCGIYAFYWYYALGNRLAANAPRYGMSFQENGTTVLLWMVLGLFLCGLGPYFGMYILIKNTNAICNGYNYAHGL